ncbi:Nucleolar protein 10 [Monoraphidium neglectum]|uniref:Nucleolar protein 10 n=1 Tax=Monoraphidium neglectum TaxID=145388 RepID=A0A0D2L7T4_9CHLO|nr:Nucleolar protein 10 [Monoraphidium neglectum]KIZ02919.1 Nucleolar protein 10 [Monoraphidium neglectum]|eukprot:XP_013901938.1 Nucleolar protein 10 [Monoraphidium neglectum]
MAMKVSASDGVKVYHVTSGKALPAWLSEAKKRALRRDEEYRRRLELLQSFGFPSACQRLKATPDGQYIFATGYHPPMLKVYDLANLAMKFDRHMDSEVVDFTILSEDYSKAAFLCADRTVSFHARFGGYYKARAPAHRAFALNGSTRGTRAGSGTAQQLKGVRTPRQGRDLAYAPHLAELVVAGSASELWRISLEEGRFMTPLACRAPGVNACGVSPVHGLFAAGGEDGTLECFDLRARAAAGRLDAAAAAGAPGEALTAVRFDGAGMQAAVGTSNGLVAIFDLRSSRPLLVKDHMYGDPIRDIKWHVSGAGGAGGALAARRVVSSDCHAVKIWDASTGEGYTSIEPPDGDINDVLLWPDSGLIMIGGDTPRVRAG